MITLNCDRIEPATQKKKDKERLIAALTIGGTENTSAQIDVSFALYFSVPLLMNFPFLAPFFFGMSSVLA